LEAGIETIEGKICTIIVYSSPEMGNYKMWVWQGKELPLKMEKDSPSGKLTIIYRNYDFGDIAESEFELPQGVIFTDMDPTGVPKLP
jgi:outer membrane lipoprotein-sorting protein